MTRLTKSLLIALSLSLPLSTFALAQTDTQPAAEPTGSNSAATAPDQLNMGAPEAPPADGPGTTYTVETFGDWDQRCLRTQDGSDPCQLYQLLKDSKGNSVAEFNLFALPAGQQAAAGATVVVPLETFLPTGVTIAIDTNPARKYPLTFCNPVGCVARVGFTQAEVDAMKNGKAATMTIVPAPAPDQKVVLPISLKGFTAGFEAIQKAVPKKQ